MARRADVVEGVCLGAGVGQPATSRGGRGPSGPAGDESWKAWCLGAGRRRVMEGGASRPATRRGGRCASRPATRRGGVASGASAIIVGVPRPGRRDAPPARRNVVEAGDSSRRALGAAMPARDMNLGETLKRYRRGGGTRRRGVASAPATPVGAASPARRQCALRPGRRCRRLMPRTGDAPSRCCSALATLVGCCFGPPAGPGWRDALLESRRRRPRRARSAPCIRSAPPSPTCPVKDSCVIRQFMP